MKNETTVAYYCRSRQWFLSGKLILLEVERNRRYYAAFSLFHRSVKLGWQADWPIYLGSLFVTIERTTLIKEVRKRGKRRSGWQEKQLPVWLYQICWNTLVVQPMHRSEKINFEGSDSWVRLKLKYLKIYTMTSISRRKNVPIRMLKSTFKK